VIAKTLIKLSRRRRRWRPRRYSYNPYLIEIQGEPSPLSDSDPALVALRERIFHMSRGCPRHGFAKIPRHYPQGHVNAGRDARGGEEAPFLHEMYLSLDSNSWKELLHPIKKTPMRSSTFAVKQPGFAKQQGPVQTEVTISTCVERLPIQLTRRSLFISLIAPQPPGTIKISSCGHVSRS
jgi:hypothetical protein